MSEHVLRPPVEAAVYGELSDWPLDLITRFERVDIGSIDLPSGQVIVCDPYLMMEDEPLTRTVPRGSHPVRVCIAHYNNGDQRIAAAVLEFEPTRPDRWELAVVKGQDISTLSDDHFFGYGVDAGAGSFMDPVAGRAIRRCMDNDPDYFETMIDAADVNYVDTRSWAIITPNPGPLIDPPSAAIFSSGLGDGTYPSYWGFVEERDAPVCLVTDFQIIDDVEEDAEP